MTKLHPELVKAVWADAIWGPGYDGPDFPERAKQQVSLNKVIIAHKLQGYEDLLREAMAESEAAYWLQRWERPSGLGKKRDAEGFVEALENILAFMDANKARLEVAVQQAKPGELPGELSKMEAQFGGGKPHFLRVGHARGGVEGLLAVARLAAKIDGRSPGPSRRDDLRAAVTPLFLFWKQLPGRGGVFRHDDDFSDGSLFLFDCLRLFDPTVTERSIVELVK